MVSIMCCNLIQAGEMYEIVPRNKTKAIISASRLCLKRELICYLKSCKNCGGVRITVFAECTDGNVYFIERIKSKNVRDFLKKNNSMKRLKSCCSVQGGLKSIPLNYFDKGIELPCTVSFSALKVAPYNPDIFEDLRKVKQFEAGYYR